MFVSINALEMRQLLNPFLFVLLILPAIVNAQLKAEDVKSFTLNNGMKFLVMQDNSIPNANMYLFYRVGSRNEYTGITGLSHFFEHMMFNGAKKFGHGMLDSAMEFNGGTNNAYTTENNTVYTDWFPSSKLELIFDIEGDRLANLAFDSSVIESERGVVHSEWRTDLENQPLTALYMAVTSMAFNEHPYHWPVIGYESDIENWKKADLQHYFNTYYVPNNCVVVITGNITTEQVQKLAKQYMEPIPAKPAPPPVHIVEPPQTGERRIMVKRDVSSPYVLISYHVPATRDSDYYALDVLNGILVEGKSSRLYTSLVENKQLATDVQAYMPNALDPYQSCIYAIANKDVNSAAIEKAIYDEIEKIQKDGVTDADLHKVKNRRLMDFYNNIETINGKSQTIGNYEFFFGDYKKLFDAPAEYNKVTSADVKRVANLYYTKKNRTVGILQNNVED